MADSTPSALPQLAGLAIEAVEWLPSGADSGLVRVRGRWESLGASLPGLPELVLREGGVEHRFESLPDARFARDPASWRGSYLVPAALVAPGPEALWVEWPGGVRSGLPPLAPGLATPPPMPAVDEGEPSEGGQVFDRAVLAERRARRAEAAEQAQTRVAAEALRAVEALELQSAELERRLAEAVAERDAIAAAAPAPAIAAEPLAPPARIAELERLADRRQAALASALASLARLRAQTRDWRLRLRADEVSHAGDAVRLAVLEADRAGAGVREELHARGREVESSLAAAAASAAEAEAARADLDRLRVESAQVQAVLEEAREVAEGRLAAALAAAEQTRERLEGRRRGERVLHAEVREALEERLAAAEGRVTALEAAQVELAGDRDSAEDRAAELGARVAELEIALAEAETMLQSAAATAATAEARLRVESVARAALEDELDRARAGSGELAAERMARAELAAALEAERLARAAERDALVVERDTHASGFADGLAADLEAEREARRFLEVEIVTVREELVRARAELAAEREARAAAESAAAASSSTLQGQIAELDRRAAGLADDVRLAEAARAQAEAAAATARPPEEASGRMVADLEAAAAALRDAAPAAEPEPPAAEPEPPAAEIEPPVAAPEPPARPRPTILSEAGAPSRTEIIGTDARSYPRLRGALVKLAHDDPVTAARLLAALLPAQAAALDEPLDYDLTIREIGTFSVKADGATARVNQRPGPRERGHAQFHLSAGAVTLAELLAGVDHRIGRFTGPARFRGSRRQVKALRALARSELGLAGAARAGAQLEPGLVYRALAYAVHPSWTRGHRFTVAQEVTDERTLFLTARDGAGLDVSEAAPPEGAAATVTLTRATFALMLRGEPVPSGERPAIRGDREAVALLKTWMDRAQGV